MVMAFGAAERGTQPSGRNGADALGAILGEVFLRLGTAFAGHHVEAVIAGSDFLFFRRIGQEVARQLLTGEGVEGLITIESVNHIIAVRENALILVTVEADGVREARDIQPPDRHTFTVMRRV